MIRTRTFVTLWTIGAAVLASGCGSACQDLAERVCNCQSAGGARDNCVTSVKNALDTSRPSNDDQSFCQGKLATCTDPQDDPTMCQRLLTPQGKEACGLSY